VSVGGADGCIGVGRGGDGVAGLAGAGGSGVGDGAGGELGEGAGGSSGCSSEAPRDCRLRYMSNSELSSAWVSYTMVNGSVSSQSILAFCL